eukprot:TRINITY_DN709_c1_g1_i2.p1 TRINITY_DN709_c1_g1~~TRINITY_DN709_c1_g1_i2.p1  ORF type:complete len:605 (+),score=151.02 TRINITY_DN709_c1_g1_i2:87-1901(+)
MGCIRWLQQRALAPGEPSVDRTRKELVAPMFCLVGGFALASALLDAAVQVGRTSVARAALVGGLLLTACSLLPVGVYVTATKRITRKLCEIPVLCCIPAVALIDLGYLLNGGPSAVATIVIALDSLLLCDCSDRGTRGAVIAGIVWIAVAAVLRAEGMDGSDSPARLSPGYIVQIWSRFVVPATVLVVDFHFTRGFARSMRTQKAMVDASVQMSELAATHLSRYETAETKALLEGPDAAGLPDGLRTSLLQLVANLAEYRPYLPQSCLSMLDGNDDETDPASDPTCAGESRMSTAVTERRASRDSALSSNTGVQVAVFAADVRSRLVSMVAVNTKSFLSQVSISSATVTASLIRTGVELFVGTIASERGVVDGVSGDHMLASFNASRMCCTHRASAARAAWEMAGTCKRASDPVARRVHRTGCACSGPALSGDFGTSDLRRFMMLGPAVNTLHGLERVAAQLGTVLVDETVGADADVSSEFFLVLVERLCYAKRSAKPFLVWQLAGQRDLADGPAEWMYEMERQTPNPHDAWNRRLEEWLNFGEPLSGADLPNCDAASTTVRPSAAAVAAKREQSYLIEATASGETVAFSARPSEVACAFVGSS